MKVIVQYEMWRKMINFLVFRFFYRDKVKVTFG